MVNPASPVNTLQAILSIGNAAAMIDLAEKPCAMPVHRFGNPAVARNTVVTA